MFPQAVINMLEKYFFGGSCQPKSLITWMTSDIKCVVYFRHSRFWKIYYKIVHQRKVYISILSSTLKSIYRLLLWPKLNNQWINVLNMNLSPRLLKRLCMPLSFQLYFYYPRLEDQFTHFTEYVYQSPSRLNYNRFFKIFNKTLLVYFHRFTDWQYS